MHRLLLANAASRIAGMSPALRAVTVAASATALGGVAYVRSYPLSVPGKGDQQQRKGMPRPVMEGICGAVGEISQICILYPLVKCQADGLNAAVVISQLLKSGPAPVIAAQLYAGFLSAALCSMVVGSIHYVSFCMSKRVALDATAAMSTMTSKTATSKAAAIAHASAPSPSTAGAATATAASTAAASTSGHGNSSAEGTDKTAANMFAAVMGALATALVEAPVELFRHQAQAGLLHGNFLGEMVNSVRKNGIGSLYYGFLPYCFESFPYDISELGVYGQLQDTYEHLSKDRTTRVGQLLNKFPSHMYDIGIGACAGASAVLVSMPFDCIKTYIQVHAGEVAAKGIWGQTVAFAQTGVKLVGRHGPGALFVGVVPRLIQQVPSSTICWWAIEQCRERLEPYTRK